MGFWRRLFGLETETEKEARRIRTEYEQRQRETVMREQYTALVRTTIADGDSFGYTIECMTTYESVVLAAIKLYTPFHYIVVRETSDEMDWKGRLRLAVHYIKEPHQKSEDPTTLNSNNTGAVFG